MRQTERAMERRIMKIRVKDRIRNERIKGRTNVINVGYRVKKLKYKYAGYVMRMKDERWVKRVVNWKGQKEAGDQMPR